MDVHTQLARWRPHGSDLLIALATNGVPMCPATMAQVLPRRVFVTVGSTRFDELVQGILTPEIFEILESKFYTQLVVQCGESEVPFHLGGPLRDAEKREVKVEGLKIELFKYKPSLEEDYDKAALIIGHGGAGTIIAALNRRKRLIVVPNTTLADNHQQELGRILAQNRQVAVCTIQGLRHALSVIPDPHQIQQNANPSGSSVGRFAALLDESVGFTPLGSIQRQG